MPEQHIIITDKTNNLYPLAWGVAGGNVTTFKLDVQPPPGNSFTVANISNTSVILNNSSISSFSNLSIQTTNSNDTLTLGGSGKLHLSCGNGITFSSSFINVGGGSNLYLNAISITASTSNFTVTGPSNFNAPVTFSSSTTFNGTANFNSYSFFNTGAQFSEGYYNFVNNASISFTSNNGVFAINNSKFFNIYGNQDSTISTTNGNLILTSGGDNGTTYIYGGSNGINVSGSKVSINTGNFTVTGTSNFTSPTTFSGTANFTTPAYFNSYQFTYGDSFTYNGTTQFISNQIYSVSNSSIATANFNYATRYPKLNIINTTTRTLVINPTIISLGTTKIRAVIDSDNTVFTNLQYIDSSNIISNGSNTYTYSSSDTAFIFPDAGNNSPLNSKMVSVNIDGNIDVDTLDNNTVVEFGVYSSYQGTLTPYPFNSDQHIAIYVALLDSSDNFYTMCLLQGYNDSCLDDGSQHCFVRLKDLLEKDSSGNTNTVLDSTWKFKLFGISHGVTEMSASTIVFKYTMYEPIKAGSGGGSSINESTLYSPYNSLSTYNINDLVIYNNNLYKCITAVTTAEAFDSNKWLNTSLSTEITDNTNSLGGLKLVKMNSATYANLPTYDNNTLYVIKD
jgi:hypothetical protein